MCLDHVAYEDEIFYADLNDIPNLKEESFEFALCRFICEIRKVKGNTDYPVRTLYQLTCDYKITLRNMTYNGN